MFGKRNPMLPDNLFRPQPNAGYRPNQPYTVDGFEFLPMEQKQAKLAEIKSGAQQFANQNFSRGIAQDYPAQEYQPVSMMTGNEPVGISGSQGIVQPMQEMPKQRGGIFGRKSGLWDVLGAFGDAFSGNGPVYGQAKQQRSTLMQRQQQAMQEAEAKRQAEIERRQYERENYLFEHDYERNNPKPVNNDTANDFALYESWTPEQRRLYHQMKPTLVTRADGTIVAVNPYDLQGFEPAPQGVTFTPIEGGSAGNGTDSFR